MTRFGKGLKGKGGLKGLGKTYIPNANKIHIDPELKAFIPPLKEEELVQLELNILEEGVRDPLVVWEHESQLILIDGHNRYGIIQKHSIEDYKLERRSFSGKDAVKDWMINLQLGRRNLTKEQGSYLRGLRYNREKKKATDNLKQGHSPKGQNDPSGNKSTADRLSGEYKVSEKTIKRDAQYANGIEIIGKEKPALKQELLAGIAKLKKSDIQAVGSGKKNVKELFEVQNPPPLSPSEGGQVMSNDKLSRKQKDELEYAQNKFEYHIKKLRSVGFGDKEIMGMIKSVMKGV